LGPVRWAGFSYPFNMTWLPAATCPCGFTPAGLPVGLQIVAGRLQDLRVLQAARAFEQVRPSAVASAALIYNTLPAPIPSPDRSSVFR
jgi:aspartyl-tRNA(Asn)/glutamyl-tRNA(Gln) amidotransferase subunit A